MVVTNKKSSIDPLTLYNELASQNDEFAEVVVGSNRVKKPVLWAKLNDLSEHEITCDTGTLVDLVDEEVIKQLRIENEAKGNTNNHGFRKCATGVKAAGGSKLVVLGQQFLTVDMGQGITFKTVFVVVRNLGVPALLGNRTMLRVGMNIVLQFPKPHILILNNKKKEIRFPIEMETANLITSYLTTYGDLKNAAILRAETPNTRTDQPDFGMRGGVKGQSSC